MKRVEVVHVEKMRHRAQARTHDMLLDEPHSDGGDDAGMTPYEALLSALGGCIGMTVRMYAERKGWDLQHVRVVLSHDKIHAKDCEDCEHKEGMIDVIRRRVELKGNLDPDQIARLQDIATRCPVGRSLTGTIEIKTDNTLD